MNINLMPLKILSSLVSVGYRTEGWKLSDVGSGKTSQPRVHTVDVQFATPFASPPVVSVGLTGFDVDQRASARISLSARDISNTGFQVDISTWMETRVYGVDFSWLAIGG